jgi:thiol-disulfide isomerase/thioredoxin
MKKYGAFFAMTIASVLSAKAQVTEINGVAKTSKPADVRLFKVAYGRMEEMAAATPAANGTFSFKFQPSYKGYYAIGFGDAKDIQDKHKLYVKGNDRINLELNDSTYVLTASNTKENVVLEQWQKLTYKLERGSVYYNRGNRSITGFFAELENVVAKAAAWPAGKETGNADFDKLMKLTVTHDPAHYALAFLLYPRASQPGENEYPAYLRNFNADKFLQDEKLLKFPYGIVMLRNLVALKNKDFFHTDFDKNVAAINNDLLKGEYLLTKMATLKSYNSYTEFVDKYNSLISNSDQKARVKSIEESLAIFKPGLKGLNFTYPDAAGKEVSLTDFKGKVVLVDLWATWCGPCRKEFPYLKELETEFHDKDVVFVSVSVDEAKSRQTWKGFVAYNKLGGIQLFAAGFSSQITKDYKITSIPRFMLFDKNGNIINVDAPRPSDPKLKELLNQWLNKSS